MLPLPEIPGRAPRAVLRRVPGKARAEAGGCEEGRSHRGVAAAIGIVGEEPGVQLACRSRSWEP